MRKTQPSATAQGDRSSSHRTAWLLWDCADLVAVYDTAHDAQEARADRQHRLLCEYGPNVELLESITVTTAALHVNDSPVVGMAL